MIRFLAVVTFLSCTSVLAEPSCPKGNVDRALYFFEILDVVNEFEYLQFDGHSNTGKAVSKQINSRYKVLKWKPESGEGGFFIFAFDIESYAYWTLHTYNFQTKTQFYPGEFDGEKCAIEFKISEKERTIVTLRNEATISIHIEVLDEEEGNYKTVSNFAFRKSAS